jgi:hypothetical protein
MALDWLQDPEKGRKMFDQAVSQAEALRKSQEHQAARHRQVNTPDGIELKKGDA